MKIRHQKWHAMAIAEVEKRLKTDQKNGLTPKVSRNPAV